MPVPAVEVDFERDFLSIMRATLYWWGYRVDPAAPFHDVAREFYNVWRRRVEPRLRTVHEAAEFTVPPSHALDYATLRTKFETGADVSLHLSGTIEDAAYEDALFNDWHIQHFHFHERPRRSGDLVYALVGSDDIYVLGVFRHQFAVRELVERIHRNWPSLVAPYRARGLTPSGVPSSDAKIAAYRKMGAMSILELSDGSMYGSPGGGYASDGSSAQTTRLINYTQARLEQLEGWFRTEAMNVIQGIKNQGRTPSDPAAFKLVVRGNDLFAHEVKSKTRQRIAPLFE